MSCIFYIAEVGIGAHVLESHWKEVSASSVEAAQFAAEDEQIFQGTALYVGRAAPWGGVSIISGKIPDPLNIDQGGEWERVDFDTAEYIN